MPTYNIANVAVDFPFEAYQVQLVYMEKVVMALESGSNALLESPTGTGKTLCLLCAALGWRRAQVEKQTQQQQQQQQQQQSAGATSRNEQGAPALPELRDGWVNTLAAQIPQSNAAGGSALPAERPPRIIYASRTHSQLQQVVRELRRTAHRPLVCMLGSREQLCCHPDISQRPAAVQGAGCQALTASNGCNFYRSVQKLRNKHRDRAVPHPQEGAPEGSRAVPDIEDFARESKAAELCPYYYARELQASSDVLFLPYNYLLDPKARRSLNIDLRRDVIIFDEAHNIDKVCAEASSFELSSIELAGAVREIDRCIDGARNVGVYEADAAADGGGGAERVSPDELARVRQILLMLDESIARLPLEKRGNGDPRYVRAGNGLRELLGGCGLTEENYKFLVQKFEQCVGVLGESVRFGVSGAATFHVQKLADALRLAYDPERPSSEYRLCVLEASSRGKSRGQDRTLDYAAPRTLGYWCFHSGMAMRQLMALGIRSVLLTSGTLSPLGSFADELGISFPPQFRLENPHVIKPQAQLFVGIFPKGPSGVELTSAYTQRESEAAKLDLGNALINFARLVPQGVLVFFPSYAALKSAHDAWSKSPDAGGQSVVERIGKLKTLVVEPREASELAGAIATYTSAVQASVRRRSGGAMLLAVCRGKLSEGVDFADAACRGVVITGLPLPPAFDAKVELKRSFLDQRRSENRGAAGGMLTGEEWYQQQAMRAVNQAVGRSIRHIHDYGAVLLCESRFKQRKWTDGLSLWLRPHVKQFGSFGQGVPALQRFFKMQAGYEAAPAAVVDAVDEAEEEEEERIVEVERDRHNAPTASRPLHIAPAPPPPSLLSALGRGASGAALPRATASCSDAHVPTAPPVPVDRAAKMLSYFAGAAEGRKDEGRSAGNWLDAAAEAPAQSERRKWAPKVVERSRSGAIGSASGGAGSSAAGAAGGEGAAGAGPTEVTEVTAAVLLQKARGMLTAEHYSCFMSIVRDLSALKKPSDGAASANAAAQAVPSWLIERVCTLFSPANHAPLLHVFLAYPGVANPPHLAPMRQALQPIKDRTNVASAAPAATPAPAAAPAAATSFQQLRRPTAPRQPPIPAVRKPPPLGAHHQTNKRPHDAAIAGDAPSAGGPSARPSFGAALASKGGSHANTAKRQMPLPKPHEESANGSAAAVCGSRERRANERPSSGPSAGGVLLMLAAKDHFGGNESPPNPAYREFKDSLKRAICDLKSSARQAVASGQVNVNDAPQLSTALSTLRALLAPAPLHAHANDILPMIPEQVHAEWVRMMASL